LAQVKDFTSTAEKFPIETNGFGYKIHAISSNRRALNYSDNGPMKNNVLRPLKRLVFWDLLRRQGNIEKYRKLVLINVICIFAIIVLIVIGTASCCRGNILVCILDLLAAFLLSACLIYLRRTGKQRLPINVGVGVMTLLYGYLFFTGGAGGTGFLWYYTYPVFTLYIMHKKDAVVANLILFIPAIIYLAAIWPINEPPYTQDVIIRFVPSALCVFIFSYLYETTRLKTHAKLQSKQAELEQTVTALRQKETELQNAHTDLEKRIDARTRELQDANRTLIKEMEERKQSEIQRKQLESKLARAKKMEALGTLAGGVAHDLNNILSGIASYPELMLMTLPADSPLRDSLKIIENSGQKAATIVEDLLTLSRRGAAIFEKIDLKGVVEGYLDSPECKKLLSFHKGVYLKTLFSKGAFTIQGSDVHLSKTVMNLVTNAAEERPLTYIFQRQQTPPPIPPPTIGRNTTEDAARACSSWMILRISVKSRPAFSKNWAIR